MWWGRSRLQRFQPPSAKGDHLIDVQSTGQHTVKPWFDGRLNFAPQGIDITPQVCDVFKAAIRIRQSCYDSVEPEAPSQALDDYLSSPFAVQLGNKEQPPPSAPAESKS